MPPMAKAYSILIPTYYDTVPVLQDEQDKACHARLTFKGGK